MKADDQAVARKCLQSPQTSPLVPGAVMSCEILSRKLCPGRRVIEDFLTH